MPDRKDTAIAAHRRGGSSEFDLTKATVQFINTQRSIRSMKTISVYRFVLVAVVFAISAIAAVGQACPKISVSGPSDDVPDGEMITFTADVRGGDADVMPTFNWTVSAGTISNGQGTSVIFVNTTGLGGQTVTATVELGGLDRKCDNSASATTGVRPNSKPRKFDEYGALKLADEHARLDNLAIEMQSDPMSQGYILTYGGKTSAGGAAQSSADKAKIYLVKTRGIDASRIVTVNGGYRDKPFTELWIVPSGASPPTASPTVDPSEVKTPKKVVKKRLTKKR